MYGHWRVFALLLLATMLVAGASPAAHACAAGDRLRRFPLGSVSGEIVLAELEEHRQHVRNWRVGKPLERRNLYWKGQIWLRRADARGKLKPRGAPLATYWATVSYYYRDVSFPLRRALAQARKIHGFRPFPKPKLYRCFDRDRCGPFRLVQHLGKALYLATPRGRKRLDIRWLQQTLKDNGNYTHYTPAYTLRKSRFAYLLQYRWGHRVVLALNVSPALASTDFTPLGWKDRHCQSLTSCAAPAPVSDHLAGMDLVVVIPRAWVVTTNRRVQ